ncbi:MAG: hypothetical protein JSW03_02480 [Candidatus Eiseniibacteriota bacterium]|nr:MAG: hypothetical protein JSW03_02480 [Candidatus Eisenbacteria bacterium]
MNLDRLMQIDRRIIYLFVAAGTILPIVFLLGLPVSTTPPVRMAFERIENQLQEGDVILVSFDYGPSSAPENDPMADAVLRHCFAKRIKVVVIALYPLGGLSEAIEELNRVAAEFPELEYGVDYVNLGYKDGAQAAMRKMNESFKEVFPLDVNGRPVDEIPMMQDIKNYGDVDLVATLATGIIGEWWANLVNAQFGLPVIVGPTAVSAPKYYAYLEAGQMVGLLGGLKGASEYERLVMDNYPRLADIYATPGLYTATKGMDVQSIVHLIMIGFILFGNLVYFTQKRKPRGSK